MSRCIFPLPAGLNRIKTVQTKPISSAQRREGRENGRKKKGIREPPSPNKFLITTLQEH